MKMKTMLDVIHENAEDPSCWLALADYLEEEAIINPRSTEMFRLVLNLTAPGQDLGDTKHRPMWQTRLQTLLREGVQPWFPTITNCIGMQMTLIPGGTFLMGSPETEKDRLDDEVLHQVLLTQPFYMGTYEVTQEQWKAVMGNEPSHFKGPDLPVEQVSWNDCQEFVKKLSEMDGREYKLPTEAQWEYACRAGTQSVFYSGNSLTSHQANFNGNYPYGTEEKGPYLGKTSPVGSYPPNPFGLYDMLGNVWEWCQDWYGPYQVKEEDEAQNEAQGEEQGETQGEAAEPVPVQGGEEDEDPFNNQDDM